MVEVGYTGLVTAKMPFKAPSGVVTVTAIMALSSLAAMSVDPFEQIYKPAGFTREAFGKEIAKRTINILVMEANGVTSYLPEDKTLRWEESTAKPYVRKAAVVDLGFHEVDSNLSFISGLLSQSTSDALGVMPSVSIERISKTIYMDNAEIKLLEAQRNAVDTLVSDHGEDFYKARTASLIEFIDRYMRDCCDDKTCLSPGLNELPTYTQSHSLQDILSMRNIGDDYSLHEQSSMESATHHYREQRVG